jgi:hypothetical protein
MSHNSVQHPGSKLAQLNNSSWHSRDDHGYLSGFQFFTWRDTLISAVNRLLDYPNKSQTQEWEN